MPPVTIVIVAWNQLERTLDCLTAIDALTYPDIRTILVDNGSEPPLEGFITTRFPEIEVLRLTRNLGFSGGYNAGIRRALPDEPSYILLLNNDTLPERDMMEHLVAEMESSAAGLVTAKIFYAYDPRRIWTTGANLNIFLDITGGGRGEIDAGQWDNSRDIDFAPFCAVLIRREVFEAIGLLDEDFFLYYEDMDYCLRARSAGWRLRFCPDARVLHDVSASSGGLDDSPMRRYWMAQSSGRFFRKHGHGLRMALIIPFRLGSAVKLTVRLLMTGQWDVLRAYWAGLIVGWRTGRSTTSPKMKRNATFPG